MYIYIYCIYIYIYIYIIYNKYKTIPVNTWTLTLYCSTLSFSILNSPLLFLLFSLVLPSLLFQDGWMIWMERWWRRVEERRGEQCCSISCADQYQSTKPDESHAGCSTHTERVHDRTCESALTKENKRWRLWLFFVVSQTRTVLRVQGNSSKKSGFIFSTIPQ